LVIIETKIYVLIHVKRIA